MVDWAAPEVDTLSALKLDQQLLNQVPFKVKTFVQEKDKEMFNAQRAFLNATGTLGGLHDCIENDSNPPGDSNPSYEEIKVALEQALCLLSSVNAPLSILRSRQQRVLAATNRSRINLAEVPLPNAKSGLFGDDFPSLASKEAELSRDLTKNQAQSTGKSFPRRISKSQSNYQGSCSKTVLFPSSPSFSSSLSPTLLSSLLSLKRLLSTECALF